MINPGERSYAQGLLKTSEFETGIARQALNARKFDAVRSHIDAVKAATPNYPGISELESELASTIRAQSQGSDMLSHARSYIEMPYDKPGLFGNNNEARRVYKAGYQAIESAKKIDAGHPNLDKVFRELETVYTNIILTHLNDKDYNEAKEFVDDYNTFDWSSRSKAMQAALDRYERESPLKKDVANADAEPVAIQESAKSDTSVAGSKADAKPAATPEKEEKKPKFIGGGF